MNNDILKQYVPKDASVEFSGNVATFPVATTEIVAVAHDLFDNHSLPLKMITATDERTDRGCFRIWYIFGVPKENIWIVPYLEIRDTLEFPSLTRIIHQAWNYERKIQTFFGLKPVGHPDNRPIILQENWPTNLFPLRKDFELGNRPPTASGTYEFQKVEGEGIYEIPVGPIHAGIIEPGHFRFSVAGEQIMLLEARLGYTHKGSEKLFETLSLPDKIRLAEKISGDSSFSHSLAFCQAVEQLAGITVSTREKYLRVIYAELERLANHVSDIGFIMLDTGFNFGGANGSRLREKIMRTHEELTGSRFLRGVNKIGGVTKDITDTQKEKLLSDLTRLTKDFTQVIDIAEDSASLINRLKGTGILSHEVATSHGVVGVAGKAVGLAADARLDYPYAAYDELPLTRIEIGHKGDVYARFRVRVREVYASLNLIQQALGRLPVGQLSEPVRDIHLKENAITVSIVEGWRGDIVYFVATDAEGAISRVAPRDPSFLNWAAVGHAGPGNVVPDFPLINKSFNLSYTGNDL